MIIMSCQVNKNLYDSPDSIHYISIVSTEYTHGNNKLTHLHMGDNLGTRLNNILVYGFDKNLDREQFFYCKTYNNTTPKPIARSTFEQKLKQFNITQTMVEQEIVEDYVYINKKGGRDTLQIVVTMKSDSVTATIDFKDIDQYENFVHPEWIIM